MIGRVQLMFRGVVSGVLAFVVIVIRAFARGRRAGKGEAEEDGQSYDRGRASRINDRVRAARQRVRDAQSDGRGYRD